MMHLCTHAAVSYPRPTQHGIHTMRPQRFVGQRSRAMARGKGKAKQINLSGSQFQVYKKLAKPMEIIGEMVRVKGSHWQGRMSAEEKDV